jgi:hypothetical protein
LIKTADCIAKKYLKLLASGAAVQTVIARCWEYDEKDTRFGKSNALQPEKPRKCAVFRWSFKQNEKQLTRKRAIDFKEDHSAILF